MLPWSPGVETGSDLRPLAKLPFFETEAWASTLLFWVPVSVVAWLATAALALVVTPARLVATAGVRLWRSFFTGPGANDKGDCSGAVARARTAATSPDSELPRATASWLLDPRHALTAPRPGAAAGDDPHCREPSAETISVNGLRTDVLVLPADGLPAGAAPAATSSRRLRSSAPAPRAGDTASLDAEPDGSSPGVGRGAVVLVVFPGNPGGAAFYRDFLKSLAMVSGQMMTIVCVSHAGHTVETATARWAITRTGEAPPESAGASSGDPMTAGWWPGEAATPLAPPSLAEQSKHKAAFLADLLASDPTLRFILAGHSIGAWVAKDVAASIPSASLVGVVGVYPTVELLGTTRRGRFGFPIFRFLAPAVATVADLLSLLPNAVLRSVAGAVLGKSASSSALDAVPSLAAGPVIRNALVMAYHEMKEVGSLNETTDAAFQAIQDRLVLFYGADDHWNAVGEPDAMRARLPRSAVVIDPHPNSHSFVLSKDECRSVAASLWGYLRALLVRSGVRPRKRSAMAGGGPAVNGGSPAADATGRGEMRRRAPDASPEGGELSSRSSHASPRPGAGAVLPVPFGGGPDGEAAAASTRRRGPRGRTQEARAGRARRPSFDEDAAASPQPSTASRWQAAASRALFRTASPSQPASTPQRPAVRPAVASAAAAFASAGRRRAMQQQQQQQPQSQTPPGMRMQSRDGPAAYPTPPRREASVESTGMDSAMDLGAADEFQREASIESMGTLMQRAGAAPSGFR